MSFVLGDIEKIYKKLRNRKWEIDSEEIEAEIKQRQLEKERQELEEVLEGMEPLLALVRGMEIYDSLSETKIDETT